MDPKKFRRLFTYSAMAQIVLVLLFSGGLNVASFRKSYVDSLVSSYTVAGGECRRKIEYAVKYGKSLENFYGIGDLLREIPAGTPDIRRVEVIRPDGRVLYDLDGPVADRSVPKDLLEKSGLRKGKAATVTSALREGKYHAFLPITDRKGTLIGALDLVFGQAEVDRRTEPWTNEAQKNLLLIALLTVGVLFAVLSSIRVVDAAGRLLTGRLSAVLLITMVVSQVAFGFVNVTMFRRAYTEMVQSNTRLTAKLIQKTIDGVVKKGISYPDLLGMKDWMGRILSTIPEIERITVRDSAGPVLHATSTPQAGEEFADSDRVSLPMGKDRAGASATLEVLISRKFLKSRINAIALDALTVVVVSFFFFAESAAFLAFFLKRKIAAHRGGASPESGAAAESGAAPDTGAAVPPLGAAPVDSDSSPAEDQGIRSLAFVLLVAVYLSASFVPVLMADLYRPLFGLSRNVVLGLPLTAEMLGTMVATILAGIVIDRRGWRGPFLTGLVVLAAGTLLSGMARDALSFVAARGLAGIGYGLTWMALRALVAAAPTSAGRRRSFAVLNAGIFAGINCGAVVGGLLAQRLGYSAVYFVALSGLGLAMIFALLFTAQVAVPRRAVSENGELDSAIAPSGAPLWAFLRDRSVIAFFLLVTIPSAVCGMYLYYFFPLHAKGLGVSQSDIGRGFLIYGVCVIFLGPALIKKLGGRVDGRHLTVAAGFLGAAALLVFASRGTFLSALVAIALLGISESVGLVSQNTYFVNLPQSQKLGSGKALSLFSTAKKGGQTLGPNAFGWATAAMGVTRGISMLALAYIALTAAFLAATWRDRRRRLEGGLTSDEE